MGNADLSTFDDYELLREYSLCHVQRAFWLLHERHRRLVEVICRHKLSDEHLAADASQRVFLSLARKSASMEHGPIDGFLARTAIRISQKMARQRRIRHWHEQCYREALRIMLIQTGWEERVSTVEGALGEICDKHREIVTLRYTQGLPIEDVAKALGLTVGAAKRKLARAVAEMRVLAGAKSYGAAISLLRRLRVRPPPGLTDPVTEVVRPILHGQKNADPHTFPIADGDAIVMARASDEPAGIGSGALATL